MCQAWPRNYIRNKLSFVRLKEVSFARNEPVRWTLFKWSGQSIQFDKMVPIDVKVNKRIFFVVPLWPGELFERTCRQQVYMCNSSVATSSLIWSTNFAVPLAPKCNTHQCWSLWPVYWLPPGHPPFRRMPMNIWWPQSGCRSCSRRVPLWSSPRRLLLPPLPPHAPRYGFQCFT